MRIIIKIVAITLVAGVFSACSVRSANEMQTDIKKEFNNIPLYKEAVAKNEYANYRRDASRIKDLHIDVGFHKKPVSEAVREVASYAGVNFDESFIPSTKYRISIEHVGTFGDFLDQVYSTTGVSYKYRNNSIKVVNKKLITETKSNKLCALGENPKIMISLVDVEPIDVFKYFSQEHNLNFTYKTRYYSLDKAINGEVPTSNKKSIGKTSLFYTGCDAKEALYSFLESIDFIGTETRYNRFIIKDYDFANVDIPTYFNYQYVSGQTLGEGESQSSSSTQSNVSIKEESRNEFYKYLNSFKSKVGIINVSNRGYISIMDYPQRVQEIKAIIATEISKQTPIELAISLVRVSLNDKLETGVDFSASLEKVLEATAGNALSIGTGNLTGGLTNGFILDGEVEGKEQIFKALQTMGKTSVVREYNVKTRSGVLSTYRAVDKIPYVTSSILATASSTTSNSEARFATAGIILNILPQLAEDRETINMSIDILISEYLGNKIFQTANGDVELPQLSENEIQVPASLKMGESVVLTGFNLKKDKGEERGIPNLIDSQSYIGDANRFFGLVSNDNESSQIVVIITPKRIKEF